MMPMRPFTNDNPVSTGWSDVIVVRVKILSTMAINTFCWRFQALSFYPYGPTLRVTHGFWTTRRLGDVTPCQHKILLS